MHKKRKNQETKVAKKNKKKKREQSREKEKEKSEGENENEDTPEDTGWVDRWSYKSCKNSTPVFWPIFSAVFCATSFFSILAEGKQRQRPIDSR